MSATYTPQPGSVASRALAHLESLDRGAEISNAQLGAALCVPSKSLIAFLGAALNAGAVFKRQKDSRYVSCPCFWSLVDHSDAAGASVFLAASEEVLPRGITGIHHHWIKG